MSFSTSKKNIITALNLLDINKTNNSIKNLAKKIVNNFDNNGRVLICGNGGSAAEAEHFVAELICKFEKRRKALPAIALHSNIPTVTAIGNDFNFDDIFTRNFEAIVQENDILIAMSTSGNSQNIINVVKMAKKMNIYTYCLSGYDGGKLKEICNNILIVDSNIVSTIQEIHLMFLHSLCSEIDNLMDS